MMASIVLEPKYLTEDQLRFLAEALERDDPLYVTLIQNDAVVLTANAQEAGR